jgi:GNAT superfamily N-acetyltransferase
MAESQEGQKSPRMQSIEIRQATKDQLSFVFATWLRNYKHSSQFARKIKNATFFKWHHLVIERIFERPGTQVLVATPQGESEPILGYAVLEQQDCPVVHYVYVKDDWRKMGIATKLVAASRLPLEKAVFTHYTSALDELGLLKKYTALEYNPYRI